MCANILTMMHQQRTRLKLYLLLRKEKQHFRNSLFCLNLGWRDYNFNFYGISLVNFFILNIYV